MKKIIRLTTTQIVALLLSVGCSYAAYEPLQQCLNKNIINSEDFAKKITKHAINNLGNRSVTNAREAVNILIDSKEQTNFVAELKTEITNQLINNCGQYMIDAINDDTLALGFCTTINQETVKDEATGTDKLEDKPSFKFKPYDYCVNTTDDPNRHITILKVTSIYKYFQNAFAYIATPTKYTPGQQITMKDLGTTNPWDINCSATSPFWNIPDDAAINTAGQSTFGDGYEYFFDVYSGDTLAFPGLLLADENLSTSESIVIATNLQDALDKGNELAKAIRKTGRCRNIQLNLVSLTEIMDNSATRDLSGWAAGTAGAGAAAATAIWGSAAASSTVPVVGWIAAAGLAIVGTGMAAFDSDILGENNRHPATVLKTWNLAFSQD